MYEWSRVILAKKSKFHDAGGPDTVVSPSTSWNIFLESVKILFQTCSYIFLQFCIRTKFKAVIYLSENDEILKLTGLVAKNDPAKFVTLTEKLWFLPCVSKANRRFLIS